MERQEHRYSTEQEIHATNNFWIGLPNDNYPPIGGEPKISSGYLRDLVRQHGHIDTIIGNGDVGDWRRPLHSSLYLNQTWREYFLTIDRLIEDFDLREQVQELFNNMRNPEIVENFTVGYSVALGDERVPLRIRLLALSIRRDAEAKFHAYRDEIIRLCMPVFGRLLEMGYTIRDLTA